MKFIPLGAPRSSARLRSWEARRRRFVDESRRICPACRVLGAWLAGVVAALSRSAPVLRSRCLRSRWNIRPLDAAPSPTNSRTMIAMEGPLKVPHNPSSRIVPRRARKRSLVALSPGIAHLGARGIPLSPVRISGARLDGSMPLASPGKPLRRAAVFCLSGKKSLRFGASLPACLSVCPVWKSECVCVCVSPACLHPVTKATCGWVGLVGVSAVA